MSSWNNDCGYDYNECWDYKECHRPRRRHCRPRYDYCWDYNSYNSYCCD